jgi:hypothetical protein
MLSALPDSKDFYLSTTSRDESKSFPRHSPKFDQYFHHLAQSKCKGERESGTEEEMEGSKYSSKLLQRPHKVTAPILQCLRYVILSHDFLAHFVALGVQAFVEWGVHVVL